MNRGSRVSVDGREGEVIDSESRWAVVLFDDGSREVVRPFEIVLIKAAGAPPVSAPWRLYPRKEQRYDRYQ